MCARYTRTRATIDYVAPILLDRDQRVPDNESPSWNVRPGSRQPVIYSDGTVARVRWGYLPKWAEAKGMSALFNAKSEKLLGKWAALVQHSRVIVPGDHWYEWIQAKDGGKQPYAVQRRDGAPLWMAGLCSVIAGAEASDNDGFLIVTAAAEAGLLDMHDSRPVVFEADVARDWLNIDTLPEAAAEYARALSLPANAFEWFPVSRDINSSAPDAADAPYLVESISERQGAPRDYSP